jgi:glycosyltransferase involved in cell wall biosynthesis
MNRELAKLHYNITLYTGKCETGEEDMQYLVQADEQIQHISTMRRTISVVHDIRALLQLISAFRLTRPLIVHTHTAKAGVLGRVAARLTGVPVIVHTFHGNVLTGYFSSPVNAIFRIVERTLARITDAICVVAPQQAAELSECRLAPPSRFHVIPLGLDLRAYETLACEKLPDGPFTVGWFGRFVPVKDLGLLCSIVKETLQAGLNVRFLIAGNGPERHIVEALAKEYGSDRVAWLGWRRDIAPVLAECHALIQTSRNEGTPLALIEGMAAGRPFVSTAVGGVVDMVYGPEIRSSPGLRWFSNCILAVNQPANFVNALAELASNRNLLHSMGRAGAVFVGQQYSKDRLRTNLDQLYTALLKDKGVIKDGVPAVKYV